MSAIFNHLTDVIDVDGFRRRAIVRDTHSAQGLTKPQEAH